MCVQDGTRMTAMAIPCKRGGASVRTQAGVRGQGGGEGLGTCRGEGQRQQGVRGGAMLKVGMKWQLGCSCIWV